MLGYYGASILDFLGLQYITAGLERLILFTIRTLTVLIGVAFMGKPLTRRELMSLLLSYVGIGLAFVHDLQIAGDTRLVLIGAGFVFASSLSYAFYQAGASWRSNGWVLHGLQRWQRWCRSARPRSIFS